MECEFVKGDRVVCVNADPIGAAEFFSGGLDGLTEGVTYTIKRVYKHKVKGSSCDEDVLVTLEEINRPACPQSGPDPGYYHYRFRKRIELKQDVFEKMRTNIPSDEAFKHVEDWL